MYNLRDKSSVGGSVRFLHGLLKKKKGFLLILIIQHLRE